MAEDNVTFAQKQMKTKPKPEEIIHELLDGEVKETALEFVAYLRANKLTPRYSSVNSWNITYKGKMLCYIKIIIKTGKNTWNIAFRLEKFGHEFSDGFKKAIQENLKPCTACLKACSKGINLIIFDKEIKNICRGWPIQFENPNVNTLGYANELMEYRKNLINTNNLPPKFFWNL
ncbi:MAG: hypothetical protein FWC92_03550 [Defluviitaleaceae bacterium]|nr:hypothetical protein [Defluviitaleaceae bacterium]